MKVSKETLKEAREKIKEQTNPNVEIVMPGHIVNEERHEERPFAGKWNVIAIEGYCFIDIEWLRCHEEHDYLMTESDNPEDWPKVPNPEYNPEVKRNEIPEFCQRKVGYNCMEKDCPYFAYAEYKDMSEEVAKVHTLAKKSE